MTQEDDDSFVEDFFKGENTVEVEQEVQDPEKQEETPEVEAQEEPKESESTADEKQDEEITKESWTKAAVLDERRKRQEYEKRVKELEEKITSFQEKPVQEPVKVPDPIDDPDGYNQYQDKKMFDLALKFDQRQMQDKHKDYEDVITHFKTMAGENPALVDNFQKQEFPATYAYETAKADLNAKKYSDPNYVSNLRDELKKEILAELKNVEPAQSKPDASSLPKLNSATSVVSNVEQKINYDADNFDHLFEDQKY